MPPQRTKKCPLCGNTVHIIAESAPGYQEGQRYTIYECEGCLSSFAAPLTVTDVIYSHIYSNVQNVPGYNRYFLYAHEVLNQKHPLDYLSRQEESYWAVTYHLRKRRSIGGRLNILEIGCGLGYFTHALAKDGFAITGIDISPQAIAWALEHYGPYYANKTMRDLRAQGTTYDAIIMNQLIEHLPDVHTFMSDAAALLAPEGELLITTPNKSAFPDAEWESDLPPVHLWWFGEEAMRHLAQQYNCTITFIDFESFYTNYFRIKIHPTPLSNKLPFFDAHGKLLVSQPLQQVSPSRRLFERSGVLELLRRGRSIMTRQVRWRGSQGPVCAAVLRRSW